MQKIDVSFSFYYNEFCCGGEATLPQGEFERYIRLAESELFGLAAAFDKAFEREIKLCLCEMAECIYIQASLRGIKSESIDGYSVTFAENTGLRKNLSGIALRRLGNTGLLYAGVERYA